MFLVILSLFITSLVFPGDGEILHGMSLGIIYPFMKQPWKGCVDRFLDNVSKISKFQ
jgi:hypothetical protein